MPDMPSSVKKSSATPARLLPVCVGGALTALIVCAGLFVGCEGKRVGFSADEKSDLYPPPPQSPLVVALGTFQGAAPPSKQEIELSMFLFGTEPPPPLALANPTGLAAGPGYILICDETLHALFRWDIAAQEIVEERFDPPLQHPIAIDVAPNGDRLICDGTRVVRASADGHILREYALLDTDFRPGGVLAYNDQVWTTNLAGHTIEIFDAATGRHLRSIGKRDDGTGRFGLARGMARTPDGNVCVVDALYARVHVFDSEGNPIRQIGQAGDSIGSMGRPKHLAVGPDGMIFITDAFSQRVQTFDPLGRPLLAFGEPTSGLGELTMPSGIAISPVAPSFGLTLPTKETPQYYILVAEQLENPGIRVYAWLGAGEEAIAAALPSTPATRWKPRFPESAAINPHWDANRCDTCHPKTDGQIQPIAKAEVDKLCLSCHDGEKAPLEPHPIGRPAVTDLVDTPAQFPVLNGSIGCLTCHDIQRHCRPEARRPALNAALLREYDVQRPLAYCMNCHRADPQGRFSPHRQRDAQGRVRDDACFFCHTQKPTIPEDGRRRFKPQLRDTTSRLCLNCHTRHWDLSPRGHVDRPITARKRQWMLMRQMDREMEADRATLMQLADTSQNPPALIPLGGDNHDMMTCYTCHNPHYSGLFPPGSELGALARNPEDRAGGLRVDFIDLCSECHRR